MSVTTILYKLMVLYMLNRVNFTLTNAQMSEFFLNHKYTDYFSFQETISELVEAKLIHVRSNHHASRYEITKDGEETLKYFSHKISPPIMNEIDEYIKENKFKLRNEVGNIADYYQTSNLDYVVHCEVREGKTFSLALIYLFLMRKLLHICVITGVTNVKKFTNIYLLTFLVNNLFNQGIELFFSLLGL